MATVTLTAFAFDDNSQTVLLTGDNKKIIKYHSDVLVAAEVEAKNHAYSTGTTLICGPSTLYNDSDIFFNAESASVIVIAEDSRGYAITHTIENLTLIDYIKLTANTTMRRTGPTSDEVTFTTTGNFFNGSFGAVTNTLSLKVAYKLQGAENYGDFVDMSVEINGDVYTAEVTLSGFDYKSSYDIQVMAQDAIYKLNGALADPIYTNDVLIKGEPVFDWSENDFNFNVPVATPEGISTGYVDTAGNDIVSVLKAKVNSYTDKPMGVYFESGGWQGVAHGIGVVNVVKIDGAPDAIQMIYANAGGLYYVSKVGDGWAVKFNPAEWADIQ